MKWLGGIAAVLVVLGVGAYVFRDALLLEFVGYMARQRTPVGPTVEIDWDRPDLATAPSRGPDRQPNIVLIVADDLGWNDLTVNGGGVAGGTVPTPHIDSIAEQGIQFVNGYSANGTCAPSRAAIMSGRYPTRFGFEFTPTPPGMLQVVSRLSRRPGPVSTLTYFDEVEDTLDYDQKGMPADEISLAETLKDAGYHTVHIGKWHLGRSNGMAPHDQGFDESLLMHSGMYLPEDDPNVVNSKQDFDPIDRFLWKGLLHAASFNGGDAFKPRGYLTDYYTEEAVKVIDANQDRPFFLYLAHWAPHTPLQATREDYDALAHIEDHRLRVYAAMIRALDRGVGQVLDALKERGLDDNTLVMFTSDNGGAHYIGLPRVNEPYRGWKISFFEGGIHVPFFMRWPGKIVPGIQADAPVHHFDLYATAAAAAGAPLPSDRKMDGVNLLPYASSTPEGVTVYMAAPHEKLFWRGGHYQVVIADGWKLQRAERPDKVWLFNLDEDPTEQTNVAEAHPEQVTRLSAMIDAHNAEQKVSAWPAQVESPITIDKTLAEPFEEGDEYVYWPN